MWERLFTVRLLAVFLMAVVATAPLLGCQAFFSGCGTAEVKVVDARANFIDDALSHRGFTDCDMINGRVPLWLIAEKINRQFVGRGTEPTMAYLEAQGCERIDAYSCAYRRELLRVASRLPEERRPLTLYFAIARGALPSCTDCVRVRMELGGYFPPMDIVRDR